MSTSQHAHNDNPTDSDVDALLPASAKPKIEHIPGNTNDPLTNKAEKTLIEDIPSSTFTLDKPPRNSPPIEEEVEVMFEDDSTIVAAIFQSNCISFFDTIHIQWSKVQNEFGLSSSSDEMNIQNKDDDQGNQDQGD